jgi:hypothetical protein
MNEAKTLVCAEVASVFLVDAARQELYSNVNSTREELRIPIAAGIAGHVATTGEAVVIKDAYHDSRFNGVVDLKTGFKTRSLMCVPLKVKGGAVIGVVQLINKVSDTMTPTASDTLHGAPECFTEDDLRFLEVFASHAASAVARDGTCPVQPAPQDGRRGEGGGEGNNAANGSKLSAWDSSPLKHTRASDPGATSSAELETHSFELSKHQPAERVDQECVDLAVAPRATKLLSESLSSWQLDTLKLADVTENRPLSTLGPYLFEKLGFVQDYGIDHMYLA